MATPDPDGPSGPGRGGGSEPSDRARVIDAIPDLVFVVDEGSRLRDWNRAVEEVTGFGAGGLAESGLAAFFDPEEHTRVEAAVREAFETRETEVEAALVTRDGDRIPYAFTARASEAEGEPVVVATGRDVSERKEKTRALEESERRLREIAENVDAAVWLADISGEDSWDSEILYISPKFEEIFGVPPEAMAEDPRAFLEHIHPEDAERFQRDVQEGDPEDPGFDLEYRVLEDDGSVRYLRTQGFPIRDEDGQPVHLAGITEDVTELRRTERELEDARERLETVLDSAPMLLFSFDGEGTVTTSRGSALDALGLEQDELVGGDLFELYADEPEVAGAFERVLEGETAELRRQVDGVWMDTHIQPRRDDDGTVVGGVGVSIDVTDRVEADQARRDAEAQLRRVIGDLDVVLFSLDEEGYYTLAEGRGLADLGLTPEDVVGRHVSDFYDEPVVNLVERALDGERLREQVEYEGTWMEVQMGPRYDGGEVVGVDGVALDVTKQVEAQREVARERHRLEQLLTAAPSCIVQVSPEGQFTYANDRAEEVLGLDPERVTGRAYNDPAWEIRDLDGNEIPDEDLPFRKVLDEARVVRDERHTVVWPDGSEVTLSVHGAPVFDDDGEVESTVFTLVDITERLEYQREVERERDLRAALFEENVDPIVEVEFEDEIPLIQAANEAFWRVFGYDADRILGRPVHEVIVPPEGKSDHLEMAERVLRGEPVEAEVVRETATGPRRFALQVIPLGVEGRGPLAYAWYKDITDLRELEREEALKARMLDQVGQAVIATDTEQKVVFWNRHAEDLHGYSSEEAMGRHIEELTVAGDAGVGDEVVAALRGGDTWTGEMEGRRKGGSTFPMLLSVAPRLQDGEFAGAIGVGYDISDVKETEARLERAQELARVGDFTHDLRTGERTWSDVLYELFERDPAEGPGGVEWLLDLVHPGDRSKVTSMLEAARQGEAGPFVHDLRMQLGEDEGEPGMRWFNARVVAETDIDGEPIRLQGTMQDVTELRALEREEAFKAHLLDQVGQAVNAIDADGTIEYWNEHAEEMFGYSSEEALGENIYELIGAHEGHVQEILDHMRRGEAWSGELQVERRDGSEVLAVFTKEPLLDEDGNLEGVIGVAYDVTEIRKLEREEALKATMLDQVGEAVIGTDAEGVVTFWNSQAEDVYGFDAEEAVGRQTMELLVPETDEGHEMAMAVGEVLERGETWTGEFESRRKDGSTFPALVSTAPIVRDGEVEGIITVARDITDIKKAQQKLAQTTNQLRARNRELRELSQAAAHEFRTPIWDTTRYLELLDRQTSGKLDAEEHEHLETALDGAHRLHDLVESLQDYLDASTREPGLGPVDAGEVIDEVLAPLAETIEETGARVSVEEPAPELAVDRSSLFEALSHVIENALLFSGDEPPEIEIAFEREDDMWIVSVADHGVGIDPQYQERIFRPFRTLHGRDEGAGPGLGLALTRGIVEAHGGHTWVKSTPGEGTTLYMTFPAVGQVAEGAFPSGTPVQDEASQAGEGDAGFDDEGPLFL